MAPHSRSASSVPCIKNWISSSFLRCCFRIIFCLLLLAIAYRSFIVLSSRRMRMSSPKASQEKDSGSKKPSSKRVDSGMTEDQNQRLQALRQELLQETFTPIYPWISPPTPLPGPYDAPYYPLPMPTLRRHSQDASPTPPGEEAIVALTHHISTPSPPTCDTTLPIRGTTTFSNHGWKRTQWTVSAG